MQAAPRLFVIDTKTLKEKGPIRSRISYLPIRWSMMVGIILSGGTGT